MKVLAEFRVLGVPRVKKNTQRAILAVNRRTGKTYPKIVQTAAYKAWKKSALPQINRQKPRETISQPINLQCRFFMDTNSLVDLSALYEGIQDELVACGVLSDDNYAVVASHDGSGVWVDKTNPRMEIVITPKSEAIELPAPKPHEEDEEPF